MTLSWGVLVALACTLAAGQENDSYLIGRSLADITLPVVGVQMMGFVRPDQISEGLHQRQYARTFVIADSSGKTRLALVTCDIAFPTHTLKLAVLDRLREKFGDRYGHANVVLAATHTHATPGGYHHHIDAGPLGAGSTASALTPWSTGLPNQSSPPTLTSSRERSCSRKETWKAPV